MDLRLLGNLNLFKYVETAAVCRFVMWDDMAYTDITDVMDYMTTLVWNLATLCT